MSQLKTKSLFFGARFSRPEIEFIDSLCDNSTPRLTRSDLFRRLITQEIKKREAPENEKQFIVEELQDIKQQIHYNQQYLVYLSSLLTALVRKSSKSDPSESERMIARAKEEAGREEKVKPVLSKERY